jgi:hypothetical protein
MKVEIIKSKKLPISAIEQNKGQIKGLPKNPRLIKDTKYQKLKKSIEDNPEMLGARELLVYPMGDKYVIIGGNMRYTACKELGYTELPCKILPAEYTAEQLRAITIKDNVAFGENDWDILANEWDAEELADWGMEIHDFSAGAAYDDMEMDENSREQTNEVFGGKYNSEEHQKLSDIYLAPPFSVLDTRQGYWTERKKIWKELIGDNGETRENTLSESVLVGSINNGVSILDPVLAEVVNLWFALPKCKTFDCFAGDSVFGYVSSHLGHQFTGIELRKEQADINSQRIANFLKSKYICDDGRNILQHIAPESQDLLFSCPPYFDLEVYSDLENDASNQDTYEDFIQILDDAFTGAIKCLKENRFAVIVVGDVRDKKTGFYYRFVDDVKDIFKRSGVHLYNDMILLEPLGTLPRRVGKIMEHRKVGKCHQNVLVFFKGDPKQIKTIYPKLDYKDAEDEINANENTND